MKNYVCTPLLSQPGIQRDGTSYDTNYYIDGQWVRFYKGRARSIAGYNAICYGNSTIIRNLYSFSNESFINLYIGRYNTVSYIVLSPTGDNNIGSITEIFRTPINLNIDDNNSWSFDLFTSTNVTYENAQIIGQVCPNASDINNMVEGNIYYGDVTLNSPLEKITDSNLGDITCSGGIVFVSPILVAYGNNGVIKFSNPLATNPLFTWTYNDGSSDVPQTSTIANTKIVYGTPVIGTNTPTALFWSLNSLSRVEFTPATDENGVILNGYEATNVKIADCSIISANCVVQYKQTFFWIGTDQFYMYDGVVRPIPNTMNRRYFFDNVNLVYRNKIFGIVIPAYDEIWWFYPSKNSTENDSVIIFNVSEGFWFDSKINRSAGVAASLFPYPILADSETTVIQTRGGSSNNYLIWQHEIGTDKVIANTVTAIPKSVSHHIMDFCTQEGGQNRFLRNRRIEPDFIMTGNMELTITNLNYASDIRNGNALSEGPLTFNQNTQYIDFSTQGRLTFITYTSNAIGGSFQGGKTLYDWEIGDVQT